jgi:ferredoxin
MAKKRLVLTFPPKLVEQPITYHLIKDYELKVNILRASITPNEEGRLVVEVDGESKDLNKGIDYLLGLGVEIQPLAQDVNWHEERCTHCTACVPICPTGALSLNQSNMNVFFDSEKCIACELCVCVCPYKAIEISF